MSMIDMFLPKDAQARAAEALKIAEVERRTKIRQTLLASGINNEILVESLCSASSQAPSLRSAAIAAGKGPLAEILTKIADKLEGR